MRATRLTRLHCQKIALTIKDKNKKDDLIITVYYIQTKLYRSKVAGRDKWKAWLRSQKHPFILIIYLLQRDWRGHYLFPPYHDIGSNSSWGHSLLPADHSGPIAGGGISLPPFYHDSDSIAGGGITSSPIHDSGTCLVT